MAGLAGITQGRLSNYKHGKHIPTASHTFQSFADGLGLPAQARLLLGLAPNGDGRDIPPAAGGLTVEVDTFDLQVLAETIGRRGNDLSTFPTLTKVCHSGRQHSTLTKKRRQRQVVTSTAVCTYQIQKLEYYFRKLTIGKTRKSACISIWRLTTWKPKWNGLKTGATRWDHQQERGYDFWVLRDPWGNEFCVLQEESPELLAKRRPWN